MFYIVVQHDPLSAVVIRGISKERALAMTTCKQSDCTGSYDYPTLEEVYLQRELLAISVEFA